MYTLMHEAEQSGAPLVRGLMWDYPATRRADGSLQVPVPAGPRPAGGAGVPQPGREPGWRRDIHLPQGQWFDYWDGRQATAGKGGRDIDLAVTLDKLPVFVRAGAILPMYPEMLYDGEKPKDVLTLDLYPQGVRYTLYEDDGNTRRYQQGAFSQQTIRMQAARRRAVDVAPVVGSYDGQLARRAYALRVLAVSACGGQRAVQPATALLPPLADRAAFDAASEGWYFDAAERPGTLHVRLPARTSASRCAQRADRRRAGGRRRCFPFRAGTGPRHAGRRMMVVNRPAEEPGHPLENAFDDNPATWFRTVRSPAVQGGPHEWVIGFTSAA
jgi:hypothetical protein